MGGTRVGCGDELDAIRQRGSQQEVHGLILSFIFYFPNIVCMPPHHSAILSYIVYTLLIDMGMMGVIRMYV